MTSTSDDEALQRLADFAIAQAQRSERRRLSVERLIARGRASEAEAVQAKDAEASALAEDVSKLLGLVAAVRERPVQTPSEGPAEGGLLEEAQAAHLAAMARLETIADAASNAVAHLQQVSPTANPALMHENALNAFRWLERTARAGEEQGGAEDT